MKVVVCIVTGYLGKHVARELVASCHQVSATARSAAAADKKGSKPCPAT